MSSVSSISRRGAPGAFTLIELIGVMAIMAIMASVLVPNVLRSIDRAAVVAEQTTMRNFATQFKMSVRQTGAAPVSPNAASVYPVVPAWATSLGVYSDLSDVDVAYNRRQQNRIYLTDPAVPATYRRMLLSSMRNGLALPAQSAMTTASFQAIWQTADGVVPPAASWGGWAAWNVGMPAANYGEYLVIQRIELRAELQPLTIQLNNTSAPAPPPLAASYRLLSRALVQKAAGPVALPNLPVIGVSGDVLQLYVAGAQTFSYILASSEPTFVFNGTRWVLP